VQGDQQIRVASEVGFPLRCRALCLISNFAHMELTELLASDGLRLFRSNETKMERAFGPVVERYASKKA
jgi:hypothetical protein